MRKRQTKPAAQGSFWKTAAVGYLVGVGAIAPGLSGGAIAVIFGLYRRLTDAVSHLFVRFRENMRFLLPIGIGGLLGVVSLGRVLDFCFEVYPAMSRAVCLGLMAGTLPSVVKTAGREGVRWWYPLFTLATLTAGLCMFGGATPETPATGALSFEQLALCGALLGFGTVVPGVSSSFLLMSMGHYEAVLQVIDGRNPAGLVPLLLGFAACALVLIKLVDWLYRVAYGAMSFAVLGLLASSMAAVFPPLRVDRPSCLLLAVMILCGVLSFWLTQWMTRKEEEAKSKSERHTTPGRARRVA